MTSATTDPSLVFIVEHREAGRRLDHVLAARLAHRPELTRSRLQGLIRQGRVRVGPASDYPDHHPGGLKPGCLLKLGERVELQVPPPAATDLVAEEISFPVLYEDDLILVLSKPPGLVVHPAGGNWRGTLVHGLLHHCRALSGISGELRPGIVHRLDKDTSGCLVVAKNDLAHRHLLAQFKGKEVEKTYLALARGSLPEDAGRVAWPVGRHPVNRKKMAVLREGGREAVTHWRVRQRFAAGYTLLEIGLETGRTHQIRVHMASLGHPLAGDRLYGRQHEADRSFGIERQWLHAQQLAFRHPGDGRYLRFTAPLWDDLQASLANLQARELPAGEGADGRTS